MVGGCSLQLEAQAVEAEQQGRGCSGETDLEYLRVFSSQLR